jgi:hypothetical protein
MQFIHELLQALAIFLPFPTDLNFSNGWGITILWWVAVVAFAGTLLREEWRFNELLTRLSAFNDSLESLPGGRWEKKKDLETLAQKAGRAVPGLRDPLMAVADATFETDQGLFGTRPVEDFLPPDGLRMLTDVPPVGGAARRRGRIVGRDRTGELMMDMDSEEVSEETPRKPEHSWGDMVDLLGQPARDKPTEPEKPKPRAIQARQEKDPGWKLERLHHRSSRFITPALVAAGPGLLTAMGILGTFIGLVMGLENGTSGAAAAASDVPIDIESLVGGLHVSFRTSVIGLVCSLVLTAVSRNVAGRAEREMGRLLRRLEAGLARATPEELLANLYLRHEESTDALRQLKRDLSSETLQDTFEKALRHQLGPGLRMLKELTEKTAAPAAPPPPARGKGGGGRSSAPLLALADALDTTRHAINNVVKHSGGASGAEAELLMSLDRAAEALDDAGDSTRALLSALRAA